MRAGSQILRNFSVFCLVLVNYELFKYSCDDRFAARFVLLFGMFSCVPFRHVGRLAGATQGW